jgi:sarcosine oxidase subunit gamma
VADAIARASAFTRLALDGAPDDAALVIVECRDRALVTLTGRGAAAALREALGAAPPTEPGGVAVAEAGWTLWTGPDEWLHVAPGGDGWALERAWSRALAPTGGTAVDVSHGRATLRLAGPPARQLLAKFCPIDLAPHALPAGQCAQTLFGKINVLLHALAGSPALELYVGRSYADALADALLEGAREYGARIGPPVA